MSEPFFLHIFDSQENQIKPPWIVFLPAIFCEFESLRTSLKITKFSFSATALGIFCTICILIQPSWCRFVLNCHHPHFVIVWVLWCGDSSATAEREIFWILPTPWYSNITPSTAITMSHFSFILILGCGKFCNSWAFILYLFLILNTLNVLNFFNILSKF